MGRCLCWLGMCGKVSELIGLGQVGVGRVLLGLVGSVRGVSLVFGCSCEDVGVRAVLLVLFCCHCLLLLYSSQDHNLPARARSRCQEY